MKNAYIFETDRMQIELYDTQETISMFGEDYLEEYGHEVPQELINKYMELEAGLYEVRKELKKIMEEK